MSQMPCKGRIKSAGDSIGQSGLLFCINLWLEGVEDVQSVAFLKVYEDCEVGLGKESKRLRLLDLVVLSSPNSNSPKMRSNSTASEPPSTAETSRVLNSSRAFLSEWLLPDLDLADKKLISMKEERTNYINLRRILQTLLRERSLDSKSTSASQFTSRQLDLAGNGKENEKLDLKVSKNEKPILNLGQNVFLAMEPMEGIEFVEKKLEILDR